MKKSRCAMGMGMGMGMGIGMGIVAVLLGLSTPVSAYAAPDASSSKGVTDNADGTSVVMQDNLGQTYTVPIDPKDLTDTATAAAGSGDVADVRGAEHLSALPEEAYTAIDPGIAPMVQNSPDIMSPFVVVGSDERRQVNSRESPYMQQPLLLYRGADGTSLRCTGALVGPRTMVTAGHCVHSFTYGGWSTSMNALFGVSNGPSGPAAYLSCPATRITAPETWTNTNLAGWDWGVVQLGCDVGSYIGHMGYKDSGTGVPTGNWNISGYPGDKPNFSFWTSAGALQAGPSNIRARYTIDTAGGQSGAPIWRNETGCGNCVIGVHTTGYTNQATGAGIHNEGSKLTGAFKAATDQFRFQ